MIPIKIVGEDGNFGACLREMLNMQSAEQIQFREDADNVILAVPLDAYEEVAKAHAGKHLINVCSVQVPSTKICLKYSNRVTSIHPMFGARTPFTTPKISIITHETPGHSILAYRIFMSLGDVKMTDPVTHDLNMAKTHLQVVLLHDKIKNIMELAEGVPDYFLTPSFRRLKEFSDQYLDMPAGTKSSVLANPFRHDGSEAKYDQAVSEALDMLRSS